VLLFKEAKDQLKLQALLNPEAFPPGFMESIEGLSLTPEGVRTATKDLGKVVQKKQDEFDKVIISGAAKELEKNRSQIPIIQSKLDDLDALEKMIPSVSGVVGTAQSLAGVGKAPSEFNSLSFSTIEPIIKIFNPAGVLPQKKLEMLNDKFVPKAHELKGTIQGKINTLRRLSKQSMKRLKERNNLILKFRGNVPEHVSEKFNVETNAIAENLIDKEAEKLGISQEDPTPTIKEGSTARNKLTGKVEAIFKDGKWNRV
jgi:hypothetical protein